MHGLLMWRDTEGNPRRPDVKFFCDLDYDPFLIMEDQQKVYGMSSIGRIILSKLINIV